ncbi:hypothetical protein POTOM_028440 [Populus tomentosa]|uniref:Shikimate kinase n=1 Tax=Populus tomentosa TaxID=118781 RepID=A0A8X7ZDW6_POPTO|nr:hypothetical protein POTOM_028440 [Populus tomentosa]
MEASLAQRLQISTTWVDSYKFPRKPTGSLRFSGRFKEQKRLQVFVSAHYRPVRDENRHRWASFEVSCSCNSSQVSTLESESLQDLFGEEALILKNKSQEIEPYLNGRCIYLVGKILVCLSNLKKNEGEERKEVLVEMLSTGCAIIDKLVEQDVGVPSVAEIFEIYGEDFFRDKETEALEKLSTEHRFVVSTGGGAVIRDENWIYMRKGISVWLDVPLEELAQRIAAVGTKSRPLLDNEPGDAYNNAFRRLSTLFEKRHKAYENAKARVSLESIAAKLGYKDVSSITPAMIAIENMACVMHYVEGFHLLPAGFGMRMMCKIYVVMLTCAYGEVPLRRMPCDQNKALVWPTGRYIAADLNGAVMGVSSEDDDADQARVVLSKK